CPPVPSLPRACVTLLGFVDLIFGHLQVSCPLIPFREKVVTYFYSGLVTPFCNHLIAKCFAQTPRGLAALRKFFSTY
ncbi:MAG: hypothetical protein ACK5O9_03185, partial [Holosporales bacterium]